MLRSFNLYSWDHHRVLRELHAEHGVSAFFHVDTVSDWQRPGHNIIRISPDGLGMPDKTFYQRFPNDSAIQVSNWGTAHLGAVTVTISDLLPFHYYLSLNDHYLFLYSSFIFFKYYNIFNPKKL